MKFRYRKPLVIGGGVLVLLALAWVLRSVASWRPQRVSNAKVPDVQELLSSNSEGFEPVLRGNWRLTLSDAIGPKAHWPILQASVRNVQSGENYQRSIGSWDGQNSVVGLNVSPDGNKLVWATEDCANGNCTDTSYLWRKGQTTPLKFPNHLWERSEFSNDSQSLYVLEGPQIDVLDANTLQRKRRFHLPPMPSSSAQIVDTSSDLLPSQQVFVRLVHIDKQLTWAIFNLQTGREKRISVALPSSATAEISPQGKWIYAQNFGDVYHQKGKVTVWDMNTGKEAWSLSIGPVTQDKPHVFHFSPNEDLCAVATDDAIFVYRNATGRLLWSHDLSDQHIESSSLHFSPDEALIGLATTNLGPQSRFLLYNAHSGELTRQLPQPFGILGAWAFSTDSDTLYSLAHPPANNTVQFWQQRVR